MKIIAIHLLICAVLVAASKQHRTVGIIENGMFIEQTIAQYDDLQVIEVPEHGNRAHIVAYLDFR
ncbi:unnamed protein product, partial [Adineta ricciae]